MATYVVAFRDEVVRLARREVREELSKLKGASGRYRTEIAALKRQNLEMQRRLSRLEKGAPKQVANTTSPAASVQVRFSAARLRALRQRLGLSAKDFGLIVGASAASVYKWEEETTRPRPRNIQAIAALRGLGKKAAAERVLEVSGG